MLWHFERLGKAYPVRRAEEFLMSELDRQRVALGKVAATLEAHLQVDWDERKRIHESMGERWPSPRVPDPECDD